MKVLKQAKIIIGVCCKIYMFWIGILDAVKELHFTLSKFYRKNLI